MIDWPLYFQDEILHQVIAIFSLDPSHGQALFQSRRYNRKAVLNTLLAMLDKQTTSSRLLCIQSKADPANTCS